MKQTNPAKVQEAQEMMKKLKELRGGSLKKFHRMMANDPNLLNAFLSGYDLCNKKDTQIPRKYRELMLMICGCARNAQTTILTHGKLAHENGASIEEIGEALRIVMLTCGVTAIIPALELFDELEED